MPMIRPLPNKPLIEAIFELRWRVPENDTDSNYALFVGRLYDRVQPHYPSHEALPTSLMPSDVARNVIQHRFRGQPAGWPLVQVGPGIVTVNDTEAYMWQDFGQRAKLLVKAVFDAYPEPGQLHIVNLTLRYLDAFDLAEDESALAFLSSKLKSVLSFPQQLFEGNAVSTKPTAINVMASFPTGQPRGSVLVRFGSGKHKDKPALIMETAMRSDAADVPRMPDEFERWVEEAHKLTDDWFFKFIEGELERRFSGE